MPIISVGNIAFGGTGKTPFTIWLTEFVRRYRLCPVVLTRGYRGNYEHSYRVIEGQKSFKYSPVDFGDEPLMVARHLTEGAVIVGKRRSENLAYFFDKLRPDVGILDDGFQHMRLFRNFNIVLFDATMPISQYRVAPKGYLREGLSALKDADAAVISRCDQVGPYEMKRLRELLSPHLPSNVVWAHICYRAVGIFDTNYNEAFGVDKLRGKKVIAVVAIASPGSFFQQLEDLGAEIAERVAFPDHYYFTFQDVQSLLEKSRQHDALIITSEKDIIKIRKISTEIEVYYMEVQVSFLSGQDELQGRLLEVLKREEG